MRCCPGILQESWNDDAGPEIYVPLIVVRLLRIVFVPLLLDGMMLIGEREGIVMDDVDMLWMMSR